jgi:UDP-N-acetyl-D-mannosaminuronic acid dehydrogenase
MKPDVVVVGAGYVGLTLAVHMASQEMAVLTLDRDAAKVSSLERGETPIFETGIQDALRRVVAAGHLKAAQTSDLGADAWILATAYFPGDEGGFARVLDAIRPNPGRPPVVMVRGTVPVGFTRRALLPVLERRFGVLDKDFFLVAAPERTLSGAALDELGSLPQVIGGSASSRARAAAVFQRARMPVMEVPSLEAAEIAKTFSNFARLVQFNLSNFFGVLCHANNVSEQALLEAVTSSYPRLSFLSAPGPGAGGFCLPKDSLVLHDACISMSERFPGLDALWDYPRLEHDLNEAVIRFHGQQLVTLTAPCRRVLAMGIAFKGKPATNDVRGSVGLEIVRNLVSAGRHVEVHDCTVAADEIRALGLKTAEAPIDLGRFDAVLILNNDPAYRDVIAGAARSTAPLFLYDPWRLIVQRDDSIFQPAWAHTTLIETPA